MKNGFLKFIVLFFFVNQFSFLALGQSSTPINDTITITGKFVSPCMIPKQIKIWKFNAMDWNVNSIDVPVNESGEFICPLTINGPQQVSLKADQNVFDFVAMPKEKICQIEINCDSKNQKRFEVKNSVENQAFSRFYNLNKSFKVSLDKWSKANATNEDTFQIIRKMFLDFQLQIGNIAKSFPATFTAQVLCPASVLSESVFASIHTLRDGYLQRQSFANPYYFNFNLLSSYVTENYFSLMDKKSESFTGFQNALEIGNRNPMAAKTLQQIFYYTFLARKKERLMVGYINWAKSNPDKMVNLTVKAQLNSLENCIAGAPLIDIQLKDPAGVTRKLSDVASSGKFTLLIFYSPTCAHCQEYLPKLVPLWNQYKSKGLRIYAVANEATRDEWAEFINTKSSPEWTNVLEFHDDYRPSLKYAITSIPTFIVIDHQGKIVTRFANLDYVTNEVPRLLKD